MHKMQYKAKRKKFLNMLWSGHNLRGLANTFTTTWHVHTSSRFVRRVPKSSLYPLEWLKSSLNTPKLGSNPDLSFSV